MTDKARKRSGISGDRAYRIEQKMKSALAHIFTSALHLHPTHEDMTIAVLEKVFGTPEAKRAPRHIRAYMEGRWDAMKDSLLANHTVWMHSLDGEFYTTKERDEITHAEEGYIEYITTHESSGNETDYFVKLRAQVKEGTYKAPLLRIDSDKSCYVWLDHARTPLKDKRYL